MQLVNNRICFTTAALLSFVSFFLLGFSEVRAQSEPQNADSVKAASRIGMGMPPELADSLRRYRPRSNRIPDPFKRKRANILEINHPQDELVRRRDTTGNYAVYREIFGVRSGFPASYSFEQYSAYSMREKQHENWVNLIRESELQRDVRRGLLDFTIDIPVGERSAFTTIFGRPEVNLRVTGTANMNVGVSIQETEDPLIPPDQQRRIDPAFDQNLQLNIQGTIGDKLSIRTDWDTERDFEFENRLSIIYEGYEDEIVQSIEMGNVGMNTGNSLIRGGSALFGIKSEAQLGPLTLTSILSQQEGQGETQTISSGSQETEFSIAPAQYEDDRHFFLDFFNRQEFEDAMSDPTLSRRLFDITRIDVYVLNVTQQEEEGQRRAISLVDLGVNEQQSGYSIPHPAFDRFEESELDQHRGGGTPQASDLGVASDEFEEGFFEPLREGQDYTVDRALGYISLNRKLDSRQALAISFAYRDQNDNIVNVGDINQGGSDRMILKLLRPANLTQSSKAWNLMMRNIYSLNSTNLTSENLEVDIYYTGGNTEQTNLQNLNNTILLRDLGLDRVGTQGGLGADNQIDFGTGTLDAANGRIVFPYLEPFGERIEELYNDSNLSPEEVEDAIDRYAFPSLYTNTQTNAREESQNNRYRIRGITKGGTQASHYLGFQLVEGSVRVRANNVELSEGVDYEVDYALGNIMITNNRYLQSGQEITIDYEQNNLFQIQQTTFSGVRAEYALNDNISLGSTWFHLKENPLQDKARVGEEPINNSIIGFDGRARFDTPWLTRVIDFIPLLQTRAESSISFEGEFAQLRPGVSQTSAVSQAIDRGELYSDEVRGLSFLDDFEGSKNSIRFMSPTRWHLAAAPHAVPGYDATLEYGEVDESLFSKVDRSDFRAQFSWYMLPTSSSLLRGVERTPESIVVRTNDVFPNRDATREDEFLRTLDFYYNPQNRGPYNYNMDLRNLLEAEPERMWGGMTTALPSGSDNLTQGNYEFLEFWVQPVLPDGKPPTGQDMTDYDGKIYIDVGSVSEDVIPNNELNTEDGLARRSLELRAPFRSYRPRTLGDLTGQFSTETQAQEDVGLDGASRSGSGYNEQELFVDFVQQMESDYAHDLETLNQIRANPSNDSYLYWDDPEVQDLPLHKRFHRMFGYLEGNSMTTEESRANTNRPDTEGLINPGSVNLDDSYYQYEIPWNPADTTSLSIGEEFIVDKVDGPEQYDRWYLVRIPLRDFTRKVGNIQNLEQVSHLRFWMSGYEKPLTMRFATFELVGNQWRKAENVTEQENPNTIFEIATINIEENSSRQPFPYRVPEGAIRSVDRGQQEQVLANEQSMLMNVEDLRSGDVRMVRRLYQNGGLNLLNYSNLRMFVHGEGYEERDDAELVLRFGNDLTDNYYEYRQPVSPTNPNSSFSSLGNSQDLDPGVLTDEAEHIWLYDENSVNLVLSSMNQLKQARDLDEMPYDELYLRSDLAVDAPPGTKIGIVGQPSLSQVTEIGIGIRNPHADGDGAGQNKGVPSLDAEVWVNELRVSGFEDQKGWKANFRTQIRMADFATINASMNRSTDGFGGIDSRLESREQDDRQDFSISSTVNLHRFLPERYGWNFPVSVSANHSQVTPRFIPQLGDIRYEDFKSAVEASNLSEEAQQAEVQQMLHDIRTVNERYSIGLSNISKNNSQGKIAQYTLDNIQLSYVYNTNKSRSPEYMFQDNWNYRTGINYRLNIRNVSFIRPFSIMDEVPVLNIISGLRFSYIPSSFNADARLDRSYREDLRRIIGSTDTNINQNHNFSYQSSYGFNYNPTPTVSTSFNSSTSFVLDDIAEIISDDENFQLKSSFNALNDMFSKNEVSARRSDYQESYTASWRPNLNQMSVFNWLNYSANFRGQFRWANSAKGSNQGAALSNQFTIDHNPEIRTQNLLEKIPFYSAAKDADERSTRERKQAREQRRRERERQKEREEARREAIENGEKVPEEVTRQDEDEENEPDLLKDIEFYGRRAILAALSLQNLNISYSQSGSSGQGGYAGGSQPYHMFGSERDANYSPTFLYRLGLENDLATGQLITPEQDIDFTARQTHSDDINIRTGLKPFPNIDITLNWSTSWSETNNETITISPDEITTRLNQTGEIAASVWSFGGGYLDFFRAQLQKGFDGIENDTNIDGSNTEQTIMTSQSLQQDFRSTYLGIGGGPVGNRSFTPIPLPNWQVTWSGLEQKLTILSDYLSRASINHQYSGRYRLSWGLNPDAGSLINRNIGAYSVEYERSKYETRNINLEKRFSPLIGLNVTWKNSLRTNLQYDYSEITSLSSNNDINERVSQGVRFTAGFSKRGFRLPFFERFNNQIDINLTVSYSEDLNLVYRLNQDLGDELQTLPGEINRDASRITPQPPEERGDARIQVTPSFNYQFSQTVTAGFEYSYRQLMPKSSGVFPRTDQDIRFNIVVSIRSN